VAFPASPRHLSNRRSGDALGQIFPYRQNRGPAASTDTHALSRSLALNNWL